MSKTRVFIYGSCVSRDTFEHLDPQYFELVHYVARQSALSAYTRPVELVAPPSVPSEFQQRMLAGDFASSLQGLIPEFADRTDLVLVDLTDERLGAYVLPDGSVITRSNELIESGAEQLLPPGSQHLPFGSDQHFQYWSQGIAAVGDLIRHHMPRAAVALLDIPWAEHSEAGGGTPDSFGIGAHEANPIFRMYSRAASESLGAHVISIPAERVTSSPTHPWGEAPFHYSEQVYLDIVEQLTGSPGRAVWTEGFTSPHETKTDETTSPRADAPNGRTVTASLEDGPNFLVAGVQHANPTWLASQLAKHPDVFVAIDKGNGYFNRPQRIKSPEETEIYLKAYADGQGSLWRGDCSPGYFWHAPGGPFGPKLPSTAKRVKELLPDDVPIFIVLRSPVARAAFAYWHLVSLGHVDPQTGIFRVPKHLGVIDAGFYARQIRHWSETVGADHLHITLYDDLLEHPQDVLARSLAVLGLSPTDGFWEQTQVSAELKEKPWMRAFQQRHPLDPQELAALHEIYRPDVKAVEAFLGRDLPLWRDRHAIIKSLTDHSA